MALVDGTPSIRLEGDREKALALIPEGRLLLYKVQQVIRNSHVSTFSMQRRVDDNSYIYALHSYGQNIIFISSHPEAPDIVEPVTPSPGEGYVFPDFYSGLVYNGYIQYIQGKPPEGSSGFIGENGYLAAATFSPTPACNQIFQELHLREQNVTRLAVYPWDAFSELNNQDPAGPDYSQYTLLRSSMYTGTMAKVVQLVMGYGHMGEAKLRYPDGKALSNSNSEQYIQQSVSTGVQVRFDYKFNRTHGINIGADGTLWLIEISLTRGILARPLPIFKTSKTEAFLERAKRKGDRAMVYALEELGCLPTGEAFPGNINPALVSGDVIRLMDPSDLRPFYTYSSYSSSCGWAFNESGSEAHNTAWFFGDDGYQRAAWYRINIHMNALPKDRHPGDPVGSGSASMTKVEETPMFAPPIRNQRFFPVKFFEPLMPGLVSHDASPLQTHFGDEPRTDAVMYVCFINNELHVLRYFRDPRVDFVSEEDTDILPGECMFDGSWYTERISGERNLSFMPYSNYIDWRATTEEHYERTDITVSAVGFMQPVVSDFQNAPEACRVSQQKVFRSVSVSESRGGERLQGAVAIPRYSRSSYSICFGHWFDGGKSGSTVITYPLLQNPNVAYGWRCFPRTGSIPWPQGKGCERDNCGGECTAFGEGEHKERKVVCTDVEEVPCGEHANSGPFTSMCADLEGWANSGGGRVPTGSIDTWQEEDTFEGLVYTYVHGYGGPIIHALDEYHFKYVWMEPSPDPETGQVQYMYATHSCFGYDCVVAQTGIESGVVVNGYAPDDLGPGASAPFPAFVGVNIP